MGCVTWDDEGRQIIVTNQLATKLLTADNKPANFDTGDRAILMPQFGESWFFEDVLFADLAILV